jgi:hypothetical protein
MWQVTCTCGHTADWWHFAEYRMRQLVAAEWHCKACDCAWKVTKDGVKILRPSRPQKVAA